MLPKFTSDDGCSIMDESAQRVMDGAEELLKWESVEGPGEEHRDRGKRSLSYEMRNRRIVCHCIL